MATDLNELMTDLLPDPPKPAASAQPVVEQAADKTPPASDDNSEFVVKFGSDDDELEMQPASKTQDAETAAEPEPTKPAPNAPGGDLEFMTELPDVS